MDAHKVSAFILRRRRFGRSRSGGMSGLRSISLLASLRLLGTVGEPINPESWMWYHRMIGKELRCPIVDTYWQMETGADHDWADSGGGI